MGSKPTSHGTGNNDTLVGSTDDDVIRGFKGNDIIYGNDGNDTLYGGDGDDLIVMSAGHDLVDGGTGHDFLDFYYASAGITLSLAAGKATFEWQGHDGNTVDFSNIEGIRGTFHTDRLIGDDGDNVLISLAKSDIVRGDSGNDYIDGGLDSDRLSGNAGDDHIMFSDGNDKSKGGPGFDVLDFSNAESALTVDLRQHLISAWANGYKGITHYHNFEGLVGSAHKDTLYGTSASNYLAGNNGDDMLYGLSGDDLLVGGYGLDRMTGGKGSDIFLFAVEGHGLGHPEIITDFHPGEDLLMFQASDFTRLDKHGSSALAWGTPYRDVDPHQIQIGTAKHAQSADIRLVYDTEDENLYYDIDGSGPKAAHLVATLEGAPTLSVHDFHIW